MTYSGDNSHSVTFVQDRLLFKHHLKELHESSIDDGIINLNFRSLSGDEPKEYLFCRLSSKKRLNSGRVNSSTLHNYRNTEEGGIWISGLNPHNGWQPWDWGRFKPDCPYIDTKNNKPIKYLSPPNGGSHPIYLDVPQHIWDKVAQRYRIKRYHSPLIERLADKRPTGGGYTLSPIGLKRSLSDCLRGGIKPVSFLPKSLQPIATEESNTSNEPYCFWSWVKAHPEIPIILTEGEKKAACLLSLGFVAISLPGIWMGRVKNKATGADHLHPDLLPMVETGRKFVILFDNDPKPSTKRQVNNAIRHTGNVIEKAGATCEVALLPEDSEKGVDDFVFANGGESAASLIAQLVKAALNLEGFLRHVRPKGWGLSSKYPANLKINIPRISEFVKLFPNSGLVVLWSGMNTGKTYLLEQREQKHPEERFLNVGHRVNLLQNLSKRLKTDIYSEISVGNFGRVKRLSITLDSLYKLQNNLNDYDCVFIDEACQNLTHLLHSKTCKEYRAEILEILECIVSKAKLVILADAHMDDVTVDFFRQMRPQEEVPFIIHNEYQPGNREVYLYNGNDSSALVERISIATMTGQKIMVVADSKAFIKKTEEMLTGEQGKKVEVTEEKDQPSPLGNLRIWSIHGDNSGSEENKVFIKDISSAVKDIDVLLASPSLGTGVDIQGDRFEAVFGAFHATTQSATECAQHLHRFRKGVPIHLWIAPCPPFGYKETDPQKIKERMLESNEMTAFLIRIDKETYTRGAEKDWALDAYCQIEANRNRSINNLREDLQDLLTEMGYNLSVVSSETA
ncbi:MAG: plasmid replication protein, CyRepA1 family, partial [Cyanobacteria bacterium P01_C01_bin.72]